MIDSSVQFVDTVGLAAYHSELMSAISGITGVPQTQDSEWEEYMNIAALRAQGYYLDSTTESIPSREFQMVTGTYPAQFDYVNAHTIGSRAFSANTAIREFYGSNVTSVGDYAFCNATTLRFARLGQLSYVGNGAFKNCTQLGGTIDITQATHIGAEAFFNAYNLYATMASITSLSKLTYLGSNAFRVDNSGNYTNNCYWYGPTEFPAIMSVPDYFYTGSNYSSLGNTPQFIFATATRVGKYAFKSATIKPSPVMPNVTFVDDYAFNLVRSVSNPTTWLPLLSWVGAYAFEDAGFDGSVSLQHLQDCGEHAFGTSICSFSFPNFTGIVNSVKFPYRTSLTPYYYFPKAISIADEALNAAGYSSHRTVTYNFDSAVYVGNLIFTGSTSLRYVSQDGTVVSDALILPNAVSIGSLIASYLTYTSYAPYITLISVPKLETVPENTFVSNYNATVYRNVYAESLKTIESRGFNANNRLKVFSAPNLESIGYRGLAYAVTYTGSSIGYSAVDSASWSFENLIYVESEAFAYNCGLNLYVDLTNCVSVGNSAFYSCLSFSVSNMLWPSMQYIGQSVFSFYSTISKSSYTNAASSVVPSEYSIRMSLPEGPLSIPEALYIGAYAFYNQKRITKVYAPKAMSVGNYAFAACTSITELTLGISDFEVAGYSFTSGYWYPVSGITNLNKVAFPNVSGSEITASSGMSTFKKQYAGRGFTHISMDSWEGDVGYTLPFNVAGSESPASSVGSYGMYFSNVKSITANAYSSVAQIPFYYSFPKVEHIGDYAFYNTRINEINFPEAIAIGVSCFYSCTSVTSVSLPKLETTGTYAFGNLTLSYIYLPELKTVANGCFANCVSLSNVSLPKVQTVGTYAFSNTALSDIVLPEAITLSQSAFTNCSTLNQATLPKIESVGSYAFYNCSNLSTVSMASAISISSYAFYNCSNLTSVYMPNVESIGQYAFYLTHLSEINFPNATTIEWYAFYGCSYVEKIILPNVSYFSVSYSTSPTYRRSPFEYMSNTCWYLDMRELVSTNQSTPFSSCSFSWLRLDKWNLPIGSSYFSIRKTGNVTASFGTATIISPYTFSQIAGNLSMNFPMVTSVGSYAFYSCSNLKTVGPENADVNLPNLSSVGSYTFAACSKLTSVDLPNANILYYNAFDSDYALSSVSLPLVKSVYSYAFRNTSALAIIDLPEVSYAYSSAFESAKASMISLPKVLAVYPYTFRYTNNLTAIELPEASIIYSYAFESASATTISLPKASNVYNYAFRYTSNLMTLDLPSLKIATSYVFESAGARAISLPNVSTVYSYAFRYTSNLTSIDLPEATHIYSSAFESASATTISLPKVVSVYNYAFRSAPNLISVMLPECTYAAGYALAYGAFREASLPNLSFVNTYCFAYDYNLQTVHVPEVSGIDAYGFAYCSSLRTIDLPKCKTIYSRAFAGCSNLSIVSLPAVSYLSTYAFSSCWRLKTLDLTGVSSVPSCAGGSNVFVSTPLLGYSEYMSETPEILVPSSLYATFTTSATWSFFSSYMVSV